MSKEDAMVKYVELLKSVRRVSLLAAKKRGLFWTWTSSGMAVSDERKWG
jgi:hypothetical protein